MFRVLGPSSCSMMPKWLSVPHYTARCELGRAWSRTVRRLELHNHTRYDERTNLVGVTHETGESSVSRVSRTLSQHSRKKSAHRRIKDRTLNVVNSSVRLRFYKGRARALVATRFSRLLRLSVCNCITESNSPHTHSWLNEKEKSI